MRKTKTVSIDIDELVYSKFKLNAQNDSISLSRFVEKMVELYLDGDKEIIKYIPEVKKISVSPYFGKDGSKQNNRRYDEQLRDRREILREIKQWTPSIDKLPKPKKKMKRQERKDFLLTAKEIRLLEETIYSMPSPIEVQETFDLETHRERIKKMDDKIAEERKLLAERKAHEAIKAEKAREELAKKIKEEEDKVLKETIEAFKIY
jgi:hypothetical protein